MDRLRQIINHIGAQMSVLTVSQRVAIGLCAALIAGSLLWLAQWSTTPEMVSLLDQPFSYESLDAAESALKGNGISYKVAGTRILVRAADRHNALRLLHSSDALPDGSLFDMAAAVLDPNPFQSPESREYAQNYAMGNELAKIISTYPFVKRASVLINPKSKRRLGSPADVPTASVAVTLASGQEMTPEIVDGFAKIVSGSVAGLKPYNVNITDSRSGRSYNVPHPDDAMSFDYLGTLKSREAHLLSKIMDQLANIPGVRAQVTVDLDTSKRVKQTQIHDAPQPKMESSQNSEQSTSSQAAEPGVQANLGTAVTAGGAGQSNTTEETVVENFEPKLRETETVEQLPLGTKGVTATVSIPRSFILGLFTAKYPGSESPKDDDPKFEAIRDEQVARVKSTVERIVMARNPRDVEVDVYPDMKWSGTGGEWAQAPPAAVSAQENQTATSSLNLLQEYGPAAGLTTLALFSMLMMVRLVRRTSAALTPQGWSGPQESGRGIPQHEPVLTVGPGTVGQAAKSESLLTAHEVDERTLRYQELGEEVAKLVDADPKGAAELLRRWVGNGQV